MTKIVGVRFHQAGKIYYFDPLDLELETATHVIVETARGVEMGTVLIPPKDVEDSAVVSPLKPVIRIATDDDEKIVERNRTRAKEAFAICKEKIIKHELDMKLVGAEYTFDNNKLLFYFTADGRIDFRELVKDLASVFRTRIELRQIGVRDETKMMGGVGICGRPLCCSTYLSDFVPVSIKMAKEQNLSLNPTKISGVCGRLMCCLKNEQDTYEYLNSRMPSVGDTVTAADGTRGEVSGINVLRQLVKVIVDNGEEKELREYPVDELHFQSRRRRDVKLTAEELKELEGLEDNESAEEKAEQKDNRDRRERGNRGNRRNNREDGGEQGSRRNNREDGSEQGSRRNNREDGGEQGNRRNNREDGGEQGNRRNNRRNRNNRNQRYDNNRGNQSNSQPENGAGE
jgi:cell fate regulator YaaT (PSP1 superfamily)